MPTFFKYCCITLLFFTSYAGAQNIPNGATVPAAATALRVPDYLMLGDTPTVYQRSYTVVKPITDSSLINMNSLVEDVVASTTYFGEFGRPVQQVIKQASPLKKDNVVPLLYDQFGRQSVVYMPYTSSAADGKY